jgi:hypothetical protein
MTDPTTLAPADIEIEYTNAGPIIHIFPEEKDPVAVIEDILQGIFLLHQANQTKDKFLESKEYASKFMNKMKHK